MNKKNRDSKFICFTNEKKGIILPETLKIVIAVLCLIILIYLAYNMYGLFIKKTAIEQARESLNQLAEKINNLKSEEDSFLVTALKDWYVVSYNILDMSFEPPHAVLSGYREMPSSCNNQNCICFCQYSKNLEKSEVSYDLEEKFYAFYYKKYALDSCNNGVCMTFDKKVKISNELFSPTMGEYKRLESVNWISLYAIPKEIYITKNNEEIILTSNNPKKGYIKDLFAKEVTTSRGAKVSFEDFIKSFIFNNCYLLKKSEKKLSYTDDSAEIMKKTFTDYFKEIKDKNQLKAFARVIIVYKDNPGLGKIEFYYPVYNEISKTSASEMRKVCDGDFTGYIQMEVGK